CLRLLVHWMRRAASRADCTAGNSSAISTLMIAMTTKSSMSVNPLLHFDPDSLVDDPVRIDVSPPALVGRSQCDGSVLAIFPLLPPALAIFSSKSSRNGENMQGQPGGVKFLPGFSALFTLRGLPRSYHPNSAIYCASNPGLE